MATFATAHKTWISLDTLTGLPIFQTSMHTFERRFRLHALSVACGHSIETHSEYDWSGVNRGEREFAVLQLTLRGEGYITYEGHDRTIRPGDLMMVHIPHDHRYRLPEWSSQWEFVYVVVVGREILRIVRRLEREAGPLLEVPDGSPLMFALYRIIRYALSHEFRAYAPKPFELSNLTYNLGMKLLEEILPYKPPSGSPSWIRKVQDYCRRHLDAHIEIAELARIAGMSRSHFSREFSAHLSMSPQEFLIQERIKHAIQLLYNDAMTIKEVGYACGYQDVNYFCRQFRKTTGMSPGEYRRSGI